MALGKKLSEIYKNNKLIVIAAGVAVVLALVILMVIKDEVTRFTLIMPIFAGFILFSILVTPDEELEDNPLEEEGDEETHVKSKKVGGASSGRKKSSR